MKMQKTKNASMLIALLLVMMAGSAGVSADGSNPLDPSDGGADWDGDGLTNAEEQAAGTDMNNPDTDNDGLPDYWEVEHGMNRTWRFAGGPGVLESSMATQTMMV